MPMKLPLAEHLRAVGLSLENYTCMHLNKQNQSGFAWGKFGPNIDRAKRHETELIWGIEKQVKKGLLSILFRR